MRGIFDLAVLFYLHIFPFDGGIETHFSEISPIPFSPERCHWENVNFPASKRAEIMHPSTFSTHSISTTVVVMKPMILFNYRSFIQPFWYFAIFIYYSQGLIKHHWITILNHSINRSQWCNRDIHRLQRRLSRWFFQEALATTWAGAGATHGLSLFSIGEQKTIKWLDISM